jgi:glycosyltransferase involved in cell wall biosynthesis
MDERPAHPVAGDGKGPLVSVIIPTYNRAHSIGETVESALRQTYRGLEVVVVDDGSTDETAAVLARYAPPVRVVRQANQGVARARNAGVGASRGSILMFLDSDDLWAERAVEVRVDVLERAGADVPCTMCDLVLHRSDGTAGSMFAQRRLRPKHRQGLWTNVADVLATRFLFTNQTLAVRRDAFVEAGGFDESLWVMEDFDLAMRLARLGPWAFTSEPLAVWHEGSADSLTTAATASRGRLEATIVDICRRVLASGTPLSRMARTGLRFQVRKAARAGRLAAQPSTFERRYLQAQRFIEEEVAERLFRHSPLYPAIRSRPL